MPDQGGEVVAIKGGHDVTTDELELNDRPRKRLGFRKRRVRCQRARRLLVAA